MLAGLCVALTFGMIDFSSFQPAFTPSEITSIRTFWTSQPRIAVVPIVATAPYQAKMTKEGSEWMLNYYHRRQPGVRVLPTRDPRPETSQHVEWDKWIDARYRYDQAAAEAEAARLNGLAQNPVPARPAAPSSLVALAGDPPPFVRAQASNRHVVKFDDFVASLHDDVQIRRKYPYFRFPEGVDARGTSLSTREVDRVFKAARLDRTVGRIMLAVASLEGGFGTVNTYDSGYVSVGFVQFACLDNGRGSLGELMVMMKRQNPSAFQSDFRRFGIDVSKEGYLIAIDPETGNQFVGPDAAKKIIADKRLTAVFHRAGSISMPFKVAQVRAALSRFYPGNVRLAFYANGTSFSGPVTQVFRSEAGLATLMDRYVNTGNIGHVERVVASAAERYGFTSLEQLATVERELIQQLRYRRDFLGASGLSQPTRTLVEAEPQPEANVSDLIEGVIEREVAAAPVNLPLTSSPDLFAPSAPAKPTETPEKKPATVEADPAHSTQPKLPEPEKKEPEKKAPEPKKEESKKDEKKPGLPDTPPEGEKSKGGGTGG